MDEEDERALSRTSSKKLTSNSRTPVATNGQADVRYQAASRTLDVLSGTSGTPLHNCIKFRDDKMILWCYDVSGVVRTESTLSLIDDFEVVAAIIVSIGYCNGSLFGFLTHSESTNSKQSSAK